MSQVWSPEAVVIADYGIRIVLFVYSIADQYTDTMDRTSWSRGAQELPLVESGTFAPGGGWDRHTEH